MTPFIAEIIGTMVLILLGDGVVANVVLKDTKGSNSGWVVITLAWGFAVYAGVLVAGPYSGAHLNPAVSIGLAVTGKFEWASVLPYIVAQCLGAMLGSILVWLSYRDHYKATDDTNGKLATFCTGPAIRNPINNVISEAIGTFVLVFTVLYIAGPEFKAQGLEDAAIGLGSLGALPVALIVVVIGMSLGGTTGYAINPARDLIPRIMHAVLPIGKKRDSDWSYAWVPVVGPVLGAGIAGVLYLILQ
jgi:glycerol uptake facilitator protein